MQSSAWSYTDWRFSHLFLGLYQTPIREMLMNFSFFPITTKITRRVLPVTEDAKSSMVPDHAYNFCSGSCLLCSCSVFFLLSFWFRKQHFKLHQKSQNQFILVISIYSFKSPCLILPVYCYLRYQLQKRRRLKHKNGMSRYAFVCNFYLHLLPTVIKNDK